MNQPSPLAPPYRLLRPALQTTPLVLTSPHSGQNYDAGFLAASRLDAIQIRRSEDSFVDELFGDGPALGMPLLAADFPRAFCDVNREAWELDPAMFADPLPHYVNSTSPRVQAGLGTIARVVGHNEAIYPKKLKFAEAQARITGCWQPYHAALQGLIDETRAQFGACLVIDCHSMPSNAAPSAARPDLIIGDGFGTTCSDEVTKFLREALTGAGLNVRLNEPYAGGYITRHYGRPREGVQVVQLEVARALYMNELDFTRNSHFPALRQTLSGFLATLATAALGMIQPDEPLSRAAE